MCVIERDGKTVITDKTTELERLRAENALLRENFKSHYISDIMNREVWRLSVYVDKPTIINDLSPEETQAKYDEWRRKADEALARLLGDGEAKEKP